MKTGATDDPTEEPSTQRSRWSRRAWIALLATMALPLCLVAFAWIVDGRLMGEKMMTRLVQPNGAMWVALFGLAWFAWAKRVPALAVAIAAVWLGFGIGGSARVAAGLARTVEAEFINIDPYEAEPFDAIILLGGGAYIGPTDEFQLGRAGDRVLTTARLWHAGKADYIICTGEFIDTEPEQPTIGEISAKLLSDVGVPREKIIILKGENTQQELKYIREWVDEQSEPKRLGLVTSAWHMRRAMKLADANELEVEPLPCHFISAEDFNTLHIVPDADNLATTGAIIKEYLGAAIGR